jgi:murein DD-endopeptidase MepM/ murein hydrolase activator NlpD
LLALWLVFLLAAPAEPPLLPAPGETRAELEAAFLQAVTVPAENQPLTFDLFTPELDEAFITTDGNAAVLWLALRDDSGRRLATEPGLALARRASTGWQVLLPGDTGWDDLLATLPDNALPAELQPPPPGAAPSDATIQAPLGGYYLPYAAGTARWMEGSISHFQSFPQRGYPSCSIEYCRYAYDFTDGGHFPLLASKEGRVIGTKDSCPNGSPSCTNYIVLHNPAEGTYQIYIHLANGTIPDKLTPGTWVVRGQYIGDTDDTGYSTSEHVHFMVTNSIWMSNRGYYWGQSVDIRFADVPINNGIPRSCYEVTRFPIYDGATECLGDKTNPLNPANDWFVSGNIGAFPPTGSLTRPAPGAAALGGVNPVLDITASASDDVRVNAVSLMVKVNGQWIEAGPRVTQPLPGTTTYDWDANLCAVAPLHGAVEVALRVQDHEGNAASALSPRTIQVDHACPPPVSQLNPAEVFDSTAARLSWQVTDSGAGFGGFELQWRSAAGTWDAANTILVPGSQRSVWFVGQPGGVYDFRLRALDINNQPEAWSPGDAAETSATLPATCVTDSAEPDNTPAQARNLIPGSAAQGNLCPAADPDWLRVDIPAAASYLARAASVSGGAAVRLSLYASDGTTLLASRPAPAAGETASLRFEPAAAGTYYLKVEPLTADLLGTDAVYSLWVGEVMDTFLPLMLR